MNRIRKFFNGETYYGGNGYLYKNIQNKPVFKKMVERINEKRKKEKRRR